MTQIKWVVDTRGAHVHVACFSRTLPTETWAKNGDLVFGIAEWVQVLPSLPTGWVVESARFPSEVGS